MVFPRTSPLIEERWYLAGTGDATHMIAVPRITTDQIDKLTADLEFGSYGHLSANVLDITAGDGRSERQLPTTHEHIALRNLEVNALLA